MHRGREYERDKGRARMKERKVTYGNSMQKEGGKAKAEKRKRGRAEDLTRGSTTPPPRQARSKNSEG